MIIWFVSKAKILLEYLFKLVNVMKALFIVMKLADPTLMMIFNIKTKKKLS